MRAKNLVAGVLAVTFLGLASTVMADDKNPSRCSNKTLKGTYAFSLSGSLSTGADTYAPEAYAAFVSYDGRGNIALKKSSSIAGEWATRFSTGIYSLGSDCVGVATYPSGEFSYFVAPDGNSLSFVKISNYVGGEFVSSPDRLSGTAQRVSTKVIVQPPG